MTEPAQKTRAPEVDIPPRIASWIREFHDRLEKMDLFELLGVDHDADASTIHQAYRLRSKQFHPDRYFGKKLGPYKAMLERIFSWVSAAFKLLSNDSRRALYRERLYRHRRGRRGEQRSATGVIVVPSAGGLEFFIAGAEDAPAAVTPSPPLRPAAPPEPRREAEEPGEDEGLEFFID